MSPRTRYWIIHWLRVVLWPLPVVTLFRGPAGPAAPSVRSPDHLQGQPD
jgi:hypothetical protein